MRSVRRIHPLQFVILCYVLYVLCRRSGVNVPKICMTNLVNQVETHRVPSLRPGDVVDLQQLGTLTDVGEFPALTVGLRGKVDEVDDDGNAWIYFGGKLRKVDEKYFAKLRVVETFVMRGLPTEGPPPEVMEVLNNVGATTRPTDGDQTTCIFIAPVSLDVNALQQRVRKINELLSKVEISQAPKTNDRVKVVKKFTCNKATTTEETDGLLLEVGQMGTVLRIDDSGDAYIGDAYIAFDGKEEDWVFSKNFGKLEIMEGWKAWKQGQFVKVVGKGSIDYKGNTLAAGLQGEIISTATTPPSIWVKFDDGSRAWVDKPQWQHIASVSMGSLSISVSGAGSEICNGRYTQFDNEL